MKTPASKTWSLSPESDGRLYSYPEGHAPSSGTVIPGVLHSVFGTGFGTRADNNSGNFLWFGHRHIHWAATSFDTILSGIQTQQAYLDALGGFFPTHQQTGPDYRLDGNGVTNSGGVILDGGCSQSGKYYQRYYDGVERYGQQMWIKTVPYPTGSVDYEYHCCKARLVGNLNGIAKCIRSNAGPPDDNQNWWWAFSDGGTTTGGAFSEYVTSWPPEISVYQGPNRVPGTWNRVEFIRTPGKQWFQQNTVPVSWDNSRPSGPYVDDLTWVEPGLTTYKVTWGSQMEYGAVAGDGQDYTDIFYDLTPARVEIWQGTVSEFQPVHSWSNTEIVIIGNKGELTSGPATLKVFNALSQVIHTADVEMT